MWDLLSQLLPGLSWTWVLVYLRVQALVLVLPGLGERVIPVRVRAAAAMAVTPLLAGLAPSVPAPTDTLAILGQAAGETLIGLVAGMGLRLLAMSLDTATSAIAATASLSQLVGGQNEAAPHPIGNLIHLAGIAVLMVLGLPVMLVQLMADSFAIWPPGGWPDAQGLVAEAIRLVARSFWIAMLLAALSEGETTLTGLLDSDDTRVMREALKSCGVPLENLGEAGWRVRGAAGFPRREADIFVGNSGLSIRTLVAVLAFMDGRYRLSGVPRMHERPIGDLVDALRPLGARIGYLQQDGFPPLLIEPAQARTAQPVRVRGDASSQFLTGILQSAPLLARERDLVIEVVGGLGIASIAFAVMSRPVVSNVGDWFLGNAYYEGGGTNVVNVILVDFRAFDTFGEIAVLAIVGLTVYALLRRFRPAPESIEAPDQQTMADSPSVDDYLFVPSVIMVWMFPILIMLSGYFFFRGHDLPGGGFAAGVTLAIGFLIQYIASNVRWVEARITVLPIRWMGFGLLGAVTTGMGAWVFGYPFLTAHARYVDIPLVGQVPAATALLFDIGVFATVVGAVVLMLVAIAHQSLRASRRREQEELAARKEAA